MSPGLSPNTLKKKPSKYKIASFENFIKAKILHSAYDFEIGILAFYNSEGMLAVSNLLTMVRRFVQLGLQNSVQKITIIEKDNHDNTYYLIKK